MTDRPGAFSDEELQRIEAILGVDARRTAVARFDIRQRHLEEFGVKGGDT